RRTRADSRTRRVHQRDPGRAQECDARRCLGSRGAGVSRRHAGCSRMGPEVTLSPPVPGAPRQLKTPTVAERKLRSGLRLYAVRKPGVPKVEVQLIVPVGAGMPPGASELLVKTLT